MMSKMICAATLLISRGSLQFKHQILILLNDLFDIVRRSDLPVYRYIFSKTYDVECCNYSNKHGALQIMETVRTLVVDAIKSEDFNETLISVMSNFAVSEADTILRLNCKIGETLKWNFWQSLQFVTDNIGKIVTVCGLDRAKRTLLRFLVGNLLQPSEYVHIIDGLLSICDGSLNETEKIDWLATKLIFTNEKARIDCMYRIHQLQKQHPKQFETISSIVNGLPKKKFPLHLGSVQLQLLQITVEIDYPQLPEMCLQKLVDHLRAMEFYKSERSCYSDVFKGGVSYLQCLVHIQQYKSNVKYEKAFEPLNEEFVVLKNEVKVVEMMKEALHYLAQFVRDKDAWIGKSGTAAWISLAEKLLQRICESFMVRYYKDLAVTAFGILYKFAKLVDHPLNQMIAAGYILENIEWATPTQKGTVKEFHSIIMQGLRDVDTISVNELGSFLLSFLQFIVYTMRHQRNIDHAKKHMQVIKKYLRECDPTKPLYLAVRLKYAEVMCELTAKYPSFTITPIAFIENIFQVFKDMKLYQRVPSFILDLLLTFFKINLSRYERRYTRWLLCAIHFVSIRHGYMLLFAKATIASCVEIMELKVIAKH